MKNSYNPVSLLHRAATMPLKLERHFCFQVP